jgi:polyisoprenoid-binding protein YceI
VQLRGLAGHVRRLPHRRGAQRAGIDDRRRDDKVQSALETSTYPTATFVLTSPVDLGAAAASGEAVTVQATGEPTIHGVTTTVTIPLQAQLVDGRSWWSGRCRSRSPTTA